MPILLRKYFVFYFILFKTFSSTTRYGLDAFRTLRFLFSSPDNIKYQLVLLNCPHDIDILLTTRRSKANVCNIKAHLVSGLSATCDMFSFAFASLQNCKVMITTFTHRPQTNKTVISTAQSICHMTAEYRIQREESHGHQL